ncbi:hypothetical protein Tco_0544838 [Tanacetum coccineum]
MYLLARRQWQAAISNGKASCNHDAINRPKTHGWKPAYSQTYYVKAVIMELGTCTYKVMKEGIIDSDGEVLARGKGTYKSNLKSLMVYNKLQVVVDQGWDWELHSGTSFWWDTRDGQQSGDIIGCAANLRFECHGNVSEIDDPDQVKDEFIIHIRRQQKEDLEQDITKEEVKRAVWDCGVDKSPGPDGFSFYFYRHFWSMIEDDVFGAVEYFFINGDIPNGCNSNFIALIPKIIDANMVKDFRPISLIGNSIYKIMPNLKLIRLVCGLK